MNTPPEKELKDFVIALEHSRARGPNDNAGMLLAKCYPGQLEIDVAYTLEDTRSSTLLRRIAEKKSFDVVSAKFHIAGYLAFFDAVLMQAWHFFVSMIDKFCQLLRSMDIRTSPVWPLVRNHGDS